MQLLLTIVTFPSLFLLLSPLGDSFSSPLIIWEVLLCGPPAFLVPSHCGLASVESKV